MTTVLHVTVIFLTILNDMTVAKPGIDRFIDSSAFPFVIMTRIADGCGVRADTQQRIVGGQLSYPGRWPWMAALFRATSSQYCAGALISDRHILTAAHCVSG